MQLPVLEGTTFAERVALAFEANPKNAIEAAELLDALIRYERQAGEFGSTLNVAGQSDVNVERWLTSLMVTAVFSSSIRRGGSAIYVGIVFFDELIYRFPEVIREAVQLRIPPQATDDERQTISSEIWTTEWPVFFEAALHREVLNTATNFPALLPRSGIMAEALAA